MVFDSLIDWFRGISPGLTGFLASSHLVQVFDVLWIVLICLERFHWIPFLQFRVNLKSFWGKVPPDNWVRGPYMTDNWVHGPYMTSGSLPCKINWFSKLTIRCRWGCVLKETYYSRQSSYERMTLQFASVARMSLEPRPTNLERFSGWLIDKAHTLWGPMCHSVCNREWFGALLL